MSNYNNDVDSLEEGEGACPPGVRSEGKRGECDFWRWCKVQILGRSYHRIYIKAVVGWGDDTGAEFTFILS